MGIKTIISVDGAQPDVETATKYGLRYVHLPHGYDGIPDVRVKELAKAVRDLEGPIYIHCHHGKHRSPAAASAACVTAGLIPPSRALAVLEIAGTNKNYRGLYQVAEAAKPLEQVLLDELVVDFRESVEIPPMAEAMVALEDTHEHMTAIAAAGWRVPESHPDLEPAHEALLLREHFTELLRADDVREKPEAFRDLLRDSETAAQELEDELRKWQLANDQPTPPESVQRSADRIAANCKTCHQKYRDVPLGEKHNEN
jgi:rhodanese-related sulfurtransferase